MANAANFNSFEQRDNLGNLLSVRVIVYDSDSSQYYADLPVTEIAGVDRNAWAQAVAAQVLIQANLPTTPPGAVLGEDAVEAIAIGLGGYVTPADVEIAGM